MLFSVNMTCKPKWLNAYFEIIFFLNIKNTDYFAFLNRKKKLSNIQLNQFYNQKVQQKYYKDIMFE